VTTGKRMTHPDLEQGVALAAAAAVTSRVRVLANIMILPVHPAGLLAKRLASLDLLSEGRVVVAAGVGDREQDYRVAGASMERRWTRAEQTITTMRRLRAGEPPEADDDPVGPPPSRRAAPRSGWGATDRGRCAERPVRGRPAMPVSPEQ
jgi:alkanesulfonate monooxygenase SsuD/methylene tetrahydromethanopterin reductase-like flavin-dependent oxidoreductase (luciferase family)